MENAKKTRRRRWAVGIILAGLGIATYMMEDSLFIIDVSFRGFYDSIKGLLLIRMIPDAPSVCYTAGQPTLLGN